MTTRLLLLLLAYLTLSTCGRAPQTADTTATAPRPNILVILADDMGFSDIGTYGGEIETPNLDRLAARSRKYRHFYNAARCCPTRAALLTGRYPHAAGMGGMVSGVGSEPEPGPYQGYLRTDVATIAERLVASGYRTWISGKWHVGERPEHWPHRRGFERGFGLISGASSYYTIRTDQDRVRQMYLDSLPWTPPVSGFYATHAYSDFAVERVRERADDERPFFGYLAYTAPHWPLHAPEATVQKYLKRYAAGWDSLRSRRFYEQAELGLLTPEHELPPMDDDLPSWAETTDRETWVRRMAVYAAMVEEMDRGIGRVLDALEQIGQLDNTLVLFFSDNGGCAESVVRRKLHRPGSVIGQPGSYEAYERPWSQVSNVPFRRYKAWVNEGGIATPLLLSWPAGALEPGWTDAVGHVVDVAPTCYAAAGLGGVSVGRSLLDEAAGERTLFWEHQGQQAVRRGDWKLLRNSPEGAWELYDLAADPTEGEDLARARVEQVEELAEVWAAWFAEQVPEAR